MKLMNRIPTLLIALLIISISGLASCSKPEIVTGKSEQGFYVEAHQILVPELHGFEKRTPESKEMILLQRGNSYIWMAEMPGILTSNTSNEQLSEIWVLVQQRIYSPSYLKGTTISQAKLERVTHPTRPYIEQFLIIERPQKLTDILSNLDKRLLKYEIERIPVGSKLMMGNYYTPMDDTVYSLTLLAPPDDFLFYQEDAKKILLEMSFDVLQRPSGY